MRDDINRREFGRRGATLGAAAVGGLLSTASAQTAKKRIKVGVIGCGSVSHSYLPHLSKSPHVELVSACDLIDERVKAQAKKFKIPGQVMVDRHGLPELDSDSPAADVEALRAALVGEPERAAAAVRPDLDQRPRAQLAEQQSKLEDAAS